MRFVILLIISVLPLFSKYSLLKSFRYKCQIDFLPKNSVLDMRIIPQNLAYYAKKIKKIPYSLQLKQDKIYKKKYFKPWRQKALNIPKNAYGREVRMVTKRPIYFYSGKRVPKSTIHSWLNNANLKKINTQKAYAITIKHASLRAMPTNIKFFLANKGSYKYFNYNQNSAVYPNTPLFISHFSKDKKFAYVQAPYSFGWIKVSNIALVDKNFIKKFKSAKLQVAIKDNLRIFKDKKSVTLVKLSTIFPKIKNSVYFATKQKNGFAKLTKINLLGNNLLANKPLEFTPKNVAAVAKEFYNEPYGWGGSFCCRDCSATTRDFLGVFGVFLSRNSSKQAIEGKVIKIPKLPAKLREKFIISHAKPFRSLLYVPGHIVLYLGTYKNKAIILHTYWGVRKKDGSKLITARTIITSLQAGFERSDTRVKSRLIYTLKSIVNF
jgi:hypothetical protein